MNRLAAILPLAAAPSFAQECGSWKRTRTGRVSSVHRNAPLVATILGA